MAKAKSTNTKADIDFEQVLWNAANELRSAVAGLSPIEDIYLLKIKNNYPFSVMKYIFA